MSRSSRFYLTAVFVGLLGLAGCQSADPQEGIKIDDVPTDRRIGTISSLGAANTSGTHLLRLTDGDTILLKSLSINLDDSKYKDEQVEVRGILTYNKGEKPLMEVQSIDILEGYELEDTEAPEWKTYSGTLYGIRYRDDFVLEKDTAGVTFTKTIESEKDDEETSETQETSEEDELTDVITITSASKDEDETLVDYLKLESDEAADLLAEGYTKSKVGPMNLEALKESGDDVLTFFVEGDANFYTISFEVSDHPDALKHENLFYEMLATFELTSGAPEGDEDVEDAMSSRTLDLDDLDDSSEPAVEEVALEPPTNFETFESESVGFSVQYPKSWYFEGSNSSEPGVAQVYNFADQPFDEGGTPLVILSIANNDTSDSEVSVGGVTLGKSVRGDTVEITYRGDGRYFRLSGHTSSESTLLNMAASIAE